VTGPLRVVIVDDEPPARAVLRELLTSRPDVALCGEADSGATAVTAIEALRPELVFLDVQLPDLDGFEVLTRIPRDAMPAIVFVTAYDEFAVRAFDVHAVDYLVKPFTDARFELAFARVRARTERGRSPGAARGVAQILHELAAAGPAPALAPPGHFLVRVGRRSILVAVSEIDWIAADRYYATLHVRSRTHLVRETMASLEARLDPAVFVRIHRSAIVHLGRVRELRRTAAERLEVVLHDGTSLDVSRSRRGPLMRRLAGRRDG
jgi:two-component system LytT family response regulator